MDNQPNNLENKPTKLRHLHWPLTPYQLFSPVSTVFSNNLTYEDQLLGLYKLYNDLITQFNLLTAAVEEMQEIVDQVPDQIAAMQKNIEEMQEAITSMQNILNTAIITLNQKIDKNLQEAKDYTDQEIAKIPGGGGGGNASFGITAAEYDSMNLAATDYDDLEITASEYDNKGRIVFFGDDSTIYLQFKSSVTANALETVFDLANPPVKLNRKYQVEISLGNFSLDGNTPAKLEIVGTNTLGNTLPITVPNGGSATVVGIFTEVPTAVRLMSGESQITGYNAYIKIKPLGEA